MDQIDYLLDNPYQGPKPIAQSGILEEIGRRLWNAADVSEQDFIEAIDDAKDECRSLRLIIKDAEFYHLPWELLHNKHPEIGFAGYHPWCTVLRRIRGKGNKLPGKTAGPLKLLLFISSPEDLDPERYRLDFDQEQELLFTALDEPYSRGEIDIEVAEDGCLETLLRHLENTTFHAVILSMHGAPSKTKQGADEWGLLFEDNKDWKKLPIAGSDFVQAIDRLSSSRRPGLFIISACRSAKAAETSKHIADVTRKLHEIGIERVLGMRLSIMDTAASVFNAELFRHLARGEIVGRAVSLARHRVAEGEWSGAAKKTGAVGDPFAQWSFPVLLDRTMDGPLLDTTAPPKPFKRRAVPATLVGDGTLSLPSRAEFIGRRAQIRRYFRQFMEMKNRCLLFTGPGGAGKTTLAAMFARMLLERESSVRLTGFRAPFDLDKIYEELRNQAFDGNEEGSLQKFLQTEPQVKNKISRLLVSLTAENRTPYLIFLDNLEILQDTHTLKFYEKHENSAWFIRTVCDLPLPVRVLMTGRYALPETVLEGLSGDTVTRVPLAEATLGDVLYRMKRLQWPPSMNSQEKKKFYETLGGNHRAIEWAAQLILDNPHKATELTETLNQIKAPPETPNEILAVVLEAMRQNLLFTTIRKELSAGENRLLKAACLYRVPVNEDGLLAVDPPNDHEHRRQRLIDYALMDTAYDRGTDLSFFIVPAVVRGLMGVLDFEPEELKALHRSMGYHHRFQGKYVTRKWNDDIEAIYHFHKADEYVVADELSERLCSFYYRIGNLTDANHFSEEICIRPDPPPPFWALNRYGMCQLVLGFPDKALVKFKRALQISKSLEDKSATLNNIGGIYRARGDYETALENYNQSLEISREIGDKAGMIPTLHNMAYIFLSSENVEKAIQLLDKALTIAMEVKDAMGIYHISSTYGQLLARTRQKKEGTKLLELAVSIGNSAGFPGVKAIKDILDNLKS